jgi:hypothetical protein
MTNVISTRYKAPVQEAEAGGNRRGPEPGRSLVKRRGESVSDPVRFTLSIEGHTH